MGFPRRQLGTDEYVVVHTRTHPKVLLGRGLLLILVGAATGAAMAAMPSSVRPWGLVVVAGLGVLLVAYAVARPFVRWATSTYTVTNHRVIIRTGVLTRHGRDVPLDRVNDVSYERGVSDRIFGCGTLSLQTAADLGPLVLPDVPDVVTVHRLVNELMYEPA